MRRIVWIGAAAVALAAAVAVIGGSTAAARAPAATGGVTPAQVGDAEGPDNTPDAPLTGNTLDKAVQAALAHTGGGKVTDTEIGDGGSAYGVEIRKPDGTHVEVNLDRNFTVTGQESDDNDTD